MICIERSKKLLQSKNIVVTAIINTLVNRKLNISTISMLNLLLLVIIIFSFTLVPGAGLEPHAIASEGFVPCVYQFTTRALIYIFANYTLSYRVATINNKIMSVSIVDSSERRYETIPLISSLSAILLMVF